MAKKSKIARNKQRIAKVAQYAEQRKELKRIFQSSKSSDEEKEEALMKLQALPRNASPTRVRNRCVLSGRPRGYYGKFGLSRLALREESSKR